MSKDIFCQRMQEHPVEKEPKKADGRVGEVPAENL
jgi:hypothetical protein